MFLREASFTAHFPCVAIVLIYVSLSLFVVTAFFGVSFFGFLVLH